jgi:hypothetical protein
VHQGSDVPDGELSGSLSIVAVLLNRRDMGFFGPDARKSRGLIWGKRRRRRIGDFGDITVRGAMICCLYEILFSE